MVKRRRTNAELGRQLAHVDRLFEAAFNFPHCARDGVFRRALHNEAAEKSPGAAQDQRV